MKRVNHTLFLTRLIVSISILICFPSFVFAGDWYVDNGSSCASCDGSTWNTAWKSFSDINWSAISPGDTLYISGGNQSKTYTETLTVGSSGTENKPITITVGEEQSHKGKVIIDGQNSRKQGIGMGKSWVTLDGKSRYGFEIINHTFAGIRVDGGADNVTLAYFHAHNNPSNPSGGAVFGVRAGIENSITTNNLTIKNCEINDNGEDAIQFIYGGDNFLVEGCYLHSHHFDHPDGIQMNGGKNTIIRSNIFTNGFMQSIFLGENSGRDVFNTDVKIYDNLIYNLEPQTINSYSEYGVKTKNGKSQNYEIFNNTFAIFDGYAIEWCCASPGAIAPMSIHDNIFYKTGGFNLSTGGSDTIFNDNCVYDSGRVSGDVSETRTITQDPLFTNPSSGDFSLKDNSPCLGKGSHLTSLPQLLEEEVNSSLKKGDLNGDGVVSLVDALLEVDIIFGNARIGDGNVHSQANPDVDENSNINLSDVLIILNIIFNGGTNPNTESFGETVIANWKNNAKGVFTMQFDDSSITQADNAVPELIKRNLVGTFYVNPSQQRYIDRKNVWEEEAPAGNQELANHTMHHEGAANYAEAEYEIGECSKLIWSLRPSGSSQLVAFQKGGATDWNISSEQLSEIQNTYHAITRNSTYSSQTESGTTAESLKNLVDNAISNSSWVPMHFHGISGDWMSTDKADFLALLDYTQEKVQKNDIWSAGWIEAYMYQKERDSAKVTIISQSDTQIELSLTHSLDNTLYNAPLTLMTRVPESWQSILITQNEISKTYLAKEGQVVFDAIPGGGNIILKQQ